MEQICHPLLPSHGMFTQLRSHDWCHKPGVTWQRNMTAHTGQVTQQKSEIKIPKAEHSPAGLSTAIMHRHVADIGTQDSHNHLEEYFSVSQHSSFLPASSNLRQPLRVVHTGQAPLRTPHLAPPTPGLVGISHFLPHVFLLSPSA